MNYFSDSSEWQYLFRNAIDWDTIIPLYYPQFPTSDGFADAKALIDFYEELLVTTGKWTAEVVAPRARELDLVGGGKLVDGRVEVSEVLKKTYDEAVGMDVLGIGMDPQLGGLGAPQVVALFGFEQATRACVYSATQLGFFSMIADMIHRFCSEEIAREYVPRIQKGEISGSMCLTEPDSGSDVGSLRTSAVQQADGTYLLNGTKCFITNGGGGLAFILARVKGAPAGLDGISMFFAEEWTRDPQSGERRHNYRIAKIEDKMGMHGSVTCEVVYEDTVARLVGEENEGFKLMLYLMNEARISVGLQGLGGIEAALDCVKDYAQNRKQFGKPLLELPLFKRNFDDWETERDGLRVLLVDTISHFDVFQKLDFKKRHTGDLTQREEALLAQSSEICRARTPLVKYYGSEANTLISQRAIQAFGGYGFMKDYDVERLHRDSFGALVYEGTSQIQALMAMKDFMKLVMKKPGRFVASLFADHPVRRVRGETEYRRLVRTMTAEFRTHVAGLLLRSFKPDLNLAEKGLKGTFAQLNQLFTKDYWADQSHMDRLMMHAETLCQAMAYLETLKVLASHASRDESRGSLFYRYKKLVAPRFAAIYADWKI
jgi:alkylation response protein AidB-like acyl-CoA dehydrogenase